MAEKGFTLIELIVAMAVASILIATGVPSFRSMIQNGQQSATYNSLVSELSYARSEAVKRSSSVSVCARATDDSCANTASWADGWLVFVDADANGSFDSSVAGEELLRVSNQVEDDQSVVSDGFDNDGFVRYLPRGNTDSIGNFVICDDRAEKYAKAINIIMTGAIRKGIDSDGNDIVDINNNDVTCP